MPAAAALFNRLFIQFIFCIQQIHLAMVCIDMAVPAVSGRIHAVKEINAAVHRLLKYWQAFRPPSGT